MVGLRDNALAAEMTSPNVREVQFARILGRWYDGCNAVLPDLAPPADLAALGDREMRVAIEGLGEVVTRTGDYLHGLGEIIAFISLEITLLPGDVVSLGPAGSVLTIPADHPLGDEAAVHASIEGLAQLVVPRIDQRGRA